MRGVFADGAGGVEVREFDLDPRPGWVAVDVAYNGICGSDLHTVMGASPGVAEVPMGHEIIGILAEDTARLPKGTAVFIDPVQRCGVCAPCRSGATTFCLDMDSLGGTVPGGMAERVLAPERALYALPDGIDMVRAAVVEPLVTCVHAVRKADLQLGDVVHVIGGGPIGIITALLAKRAGASQVTLSEPSAERRKLAAELGIETTDATVGTHSAQVVFDASGHPSVAPTLTSWAASAGTIVAIGIYPAGPQGVDLMDLSLRELTLRGSLTYSHIDIEGGIALLEDDSLPLQRLVTDVVSLDGVGEAIRKLHAGEGMKILVRA